MKMMKMPASRHAQRGVTLFVGLIMLVLITLMVTTAFMLSNTNLKSVGNMQSRDEAIAAANNAIEKMLSLPAIDAVKEQKYQIDINNDGTTDYDVSVATPVCIRAAIETFAVTSSVTLGAPMSTVNSWNTTWDIEAIVNDAKTGAKTLVNVGARMLLDQADKDLLCK